MVGVAQSCRSLSCQVIFVFQPNTRIFLLLYYAKMSTSQDRETNKPQSKKLRTACDICHQAKMKCSGGTPCQGCRGSDHDCIYSVSKRIGRPKGTKNKRTTERANRQQSEKARKANKSEREGQVPVSTPCPGQVSRPQTQPILFDTSTAQQPAMMGSMSIDMLLESAANGPYSLSSPETRGLFAENNNRWYDFGDLAGTSPLKVSIASNLLINDLRRFVASSYLGKVLTRFERSRNLPFPLRSNPSDHSQMTTFSAIPITIQHTSPQAVSTARWETSLLSRFLRAT